MTRKFLFLLLPLIALVACEPNNPPSSGNGNGNNEETPNEDTTTIVVPSAFPKKHIIEHFTGEACGYCPYGMAFIQDYLKDKTNFIWVSHHAGFADDQFTIAGNKTLATKLGVKGAPMVVLDRTKQKYVDQDTRKQTTSLVFHPAYLSELLTELEDSTYASVAIKHSFDAATRNLNIVVNGLVADTTVSELQLTVLIKENNLIGSQADYLSTWDGWTEFRHNKVVRTFLTAPLGDKIAVEKQQYADTLTTTLDEAWNPDNCVIVAYITPTNNQPIINAEQASVVANTTGGEEFLFEGITMKEVPASFPEEGAPVTDVVFNQILDQQAGTLQNGTPYLGLMLFSTSTVPYQGYTEYPLAVIYLIGYSKLTAGTYPLEYTFNKNTAISGEKFEEEFAIDGSMLYYAYLYEGSLYPDAQWLLHKGTITVDAKGGIVIDATTLNGSSFKGTYTPSASAPAAKPAKLAVPFRMTNRMMHEDMPAVKYNLMRSL